MTEQTITPELRRWIAAQLDAGFAAEALVASLCRGGWSEPVARRAVEAATGLAPAATRHSGPLPGQALVQASAALHIDGQAVQLLVHLQRPHLVVLGGLLADDECDALVALARPRLARSETVDTQHGGSEINAARTSDGMFFARGELELVDRIERRIAALLDWPLDHGEGLQVLRYLPGAEYRPHHDYFDPACPGTGAVLQRGGQRVGTLVMYLAAPLGGGATVFPDLGLEVAPVKGHAVFFSYDRPDPATRTLHGGAPVLAGEKWVATKWLRERRFE